MERVAIVGLGNLLLRVEGVGVQAVYLLQKRGLPLGVEVIDGGTAVLELLELFQGAKRIVVIDALRGGQPPGTIYRLVPQDLRFREGTLSLHQVGLLETLRMAELLGGHGQVVIIGVEPKEIGWGMDLSPEVAAQLPRLAELALSEALRCTS